MIDDLKWFKALSFRSTATFGKLSELSQKENETIEMELEEIDKGVMRMNNESENDRKGFKRNSTIIKVG